MSVREAPTNDAIYLEEDGIRLMDPAYFTPEIEKFHLYEKIRISKLCADGGYKLMIEFGCADYRLADSRKIHCDYLGVDINPPIIRRDPARRAAIICCEALRLLSSARAVERVRARYGNKVLLVIPFNFLGTMDEPLEFLKGLAKTHFDIALSLFKPTELATRASIEYYNKCGIIVANIERKSEWTKLDCSNGFKAFAFSYAFIEAKALDLGYAITGYEGSGSFYFVLCTPDMLLPKALTLA